MKGPAMDNEVRAFLEELHLAGVKHDTGKADRLDRFRNVEPDTAQVLWLLVRATGARRILEVGTSNGYSTVWLADAVRPAGGRVISVELDPVRSTMAAGNLDRAGLRQFVDLRVEDAAITLSHAESGAWDMIFLDCERPFYVGYWPDLVRLLRPGGLLVVDNVISHAEQLTEFRALVASDRRVDAAPVPTGAGALLVVRGTEPLLPT
jgi:predicted O-methyltransferase YrrM